MFRTSGHRHAPLSGIMLMVGAFATFSLLDSTAKYLGQYISIGEVAASRYGFGAAFALLAGWLLFGRGFARVQHRKLQVLRGLMMFGATFFNFMAVRYLQLAVTSAILFTTPLIVCALSPFVLGEQVGWRRWAAVLAGFAGVLVIMRPGTANFHPAMFLSLGAALTLAGYQVLTRKVGASDNPFASVLWATLVGAVASVPLLATGVHAPYGSLWWPMAFMGLAATFGHVLLTEAHRRADASLLAPFAYSQMLWMVLIGWWWFGDVPDHYTVLGALMVATAGLFVFYREQRAARRQARVGAVAAATSPEVEAEAH